MYFYIPIILPNIIHRYCNVNVNVLFSVYVQFIKVPFWITEGHLLHGGDGIKALYKEKSCLYDVTMNLLSGDLPLGGPICLLQREDYNTPTMRR